MRLKPVSFSTRLLLLALCSAVPWLTATAESQSSGQYSASSQSDPSAMPTQDQSSGSSGSSAAESAARTYRFGGSDSAQDRSTAGRSAGSASTPSGSASRMAETSGTDQRGYGSGPSSGYGGGYGGPGWYGYGAPRPGPGSQRYGYRQYSPYPTPGSYGSRWGARPDYSGYGGWDSESAQSYSSGSGQAQRADARGWRQFDLNRDGMLDHSEFSAFERRFTSDQEN